MNKEKPQYLLRLYVAGSTALSAHTILELKRLCQESLQGRYELVIVDVYQRPSLASREQIVAIPTLVRELPLPLKRLVGKLQDLKRIMVAADLEKIELDESFKETTAEKKKHVA